MYALLTNHNLSPFDPIIVIMSYIVVLYREPIKFRDIQWRLQSLLVHLELTIPITQRKI